MGFNMENDPNTRQLPGLDQIPLFSEQVPCTWSREPQYLVPWRVWVEADELEAWNGGYEDIDNTT